MKRNLACIAGCMVLALSIQTYAEEGGSGHYMPGGASSFIDAFPGKPGGVAILNYVTYYDADAAASAQLPLGGLLSLGMRAKVISETVVVLYQTHWEVFGGGVAVGAALPFVWLDIDARAQRIGPGGALGPVYRANDSASAIGDMSLIPVMIGWTNLVPDLKLDTRLTIYAPTGEYDEGELANTGKNFWTFQPGIMASWFSSKLGTEASLFSALDFNTRNDDTKYQSGAAMHFDGTLAQHLPLLDGVAGIGVTGFYYKQIEGDSGPGAVLGDFKSRTTGYGPVLSYLQPVGESQLLIELKWMVESDVKNRLEGDYVWLKACLLF